MRKREIKKAKDNEIIVDYISSNISWHLNYNSGKSVDQLGKHCHDLEEEIIKRGILTSDDIGKFRQ